MNLMNLFVIHVIVPTLLGLALYGLARAVYR